MLCIKYFRMVLVSLTLILLSAPLVCEAKAASKQTRPSRTSVFRINIGRKTGTHVLKQTLRPYATHIYRFRGVSGMDISLRLQSPEHPVDVVFWIETKGWFRPDSNTALLAGIDKGGVTSWSGLLPGTGEYAIFVANPSISDHIVRRPLAYELEVKVK